MNLCPSCILLGYCRNRSAWLVTDKELDNPEFVRDVREAARAEAVSPDHWIDHITRLYRDYRGWITVIGGGRVFLDMDEFERPSIREWFRDFCVTPCPPEITPRVRDEARERVRILATILRALNPERAQFWGLRSDNDNEPTAR